MVRPDRKSCTTPHRIRNGPCNAADVSLFCMYEKMTIQCKNRSARDSPFRCTGVHMCVCVCGARGHGTLRGCICLYALNSTLPKHCIEQFGVVAVKWGVVATNTKTINYLNLKTLATNGGSMRL